MSILIRKEGMLSTVQDLGRIGFRRFGVNPNGVMDRDAATVINLLLGNDEATAVLEMHFPAGVIEFETECLFVIGGADFAPQLNGKSVRNWTVHKSNAGNTLSFPKKIWGNRAYLSIQGGFKVHRWLGSSSTNLKACIGGFDGRKLRTGDRLEFNDPACDRSHRLGLSIGPSLTPAYFNSSKIIVTPGPEFEMLTAVSQEKLFHSPYRILPNSDRMGFRTIGEALFRMDDNELLSSGVTFGTIQLLPDGQMIVLMADHQTTGGYPRILSVASHDLSRLAQMGPGDEIRFELIGIAEAERQYLEFRKSLLFLRTGLIARTSGVL